MDETLLRRAESAALAWDPVRGGRRSWVCFEDDKAYDLGPDEDGVRFRAISERMMSGRYYPADAVRFSGRSLQEKRHLRVGDRVLQQAPIFFGLGGPTIPSSVEIYVADLTDERCHVGYVTTEYHVGRGIWSAELTRNGTKLILRVTSTACPNKLLFWIGLPIARWMQLRARRRAVEEFRKI